MPKLWFKDIIAGLGLVSFVTACMILGAVAADLLKGVPWLHI